MAFPYTFAIGQRGRSPPCVEAANVNEEVHGRIEANILS